MELKTPETPRLRALWVETPVMVRLHSAASEAPASRGFSFVLRPRAKPETLPVRQSVRQRHRTSPTRGCFNLP